MRPVRTRRELLVLALMAAFLFVLFPSRWGG